jgi:hypothetical protein
MQRRERERIMRQGVVLPETPRDRRNLSGLEQDLRDSPLKGEPLPLRLRAGPSDASAYLASLGGPRPYMTRLREIARLTAAHEAALAEARAAVPDEPTWLEVAAVWDFGDVNDLIERHNRWYPVESRLPMDPRTGDYALVNGEHYGRPLLDATWVLERFPAGSPRVPTPRG